ncbi:hypothetical protein FHP91_11955 [Denitromonas halophila]|uniref:Abi family protein n=2 Tax=Denitromonas halophila TaxID=1629404 RepID=A0A557QSP7_9RHOO|nr:hypothetical protein FHP91_11955 [Denitromonas halophila]
MATYETVTGGLDQAAALKLYAWNAQVSAALLAPLHVCEVVIRNAVAEAIEAQYGPKWPWSPSFERSLPDPTIGYSPRKDLLSARRSATTVGKVIPELKFVFWQKMFTARYDQRLWSPHLQTVLPNFDLAMSVTALRLKIYHELEQIRTLRNRIAHHEPIFTRNLVDDFQKIADLIALRCAVTAEWMVKNQHALALINHRP